MKPDLVFLLFLFLSFFCFIFAGARREEHGGILTAGPQCNRILSEPFRKSISSICAMEEIDPERKNPVRNLKKDNI